MGVPEKLLYTKTHEWVKIEDGAYYIGITDHAQEALGDLVFISLPEVGSELKKGEPFADVESVKAVSSVYSPVCGVVAGVNDELSDSPDKINSAPYDSWFVKAESVSDMSGLLSACEYEKFLSEEESE